jgi:hypothetical protein
VRGGDSIEGGEGWNIALGDHGYLDWTASDPTRAYARAHGGDDDDAGDIDRIVSTDTGAQYGGNDTITSGSGADVIIGGQGADTIVAGNGWNIVIGDGGELFAAARNVRNWDTVAVSGFLPMTLGLIRTVQPDVGGADTITTGSHPDIVLGGAGGDVITVAPTAGGDRRLERRAR